MVRLPGSRSVACLALLASVAMAQVFPDLLYYKFNEATGVGGTTQNSASPGVGFPSAPVTGHSLTAGVGQFGGGLVGATPGASTNFVDTGWVTSLPATGWTISFWANVSVGPTTTLYYTFGDSTAGSFRSFFNGAAGVGNCILRGGFTDVTITGAGAGGPHVVTYVFDPAIPAILGYLDGVLVTTVNQSVAVTGTGNFRVGGYNTSSFGSGVLLDEFRVFNRALTAAEVAATFAVELFSTNALSVTQSGPGVGDLFVGVTNLSPTASEGWTLISADTSAPAGTGPFFGITPDALTWAYLFTSPLIDGYLFHFPVPSPTGSFPNNPFVLGPGSISGLAGATLDVTLLLVQPGFVYDGRSNVVRITFQ